MNILLVEDDAVLADGLTHTLSKSGYHLSCATRGAYAEHLLDAQDFDLVVLDLGLPDMCGLDLLRRLRERKLPLPVLVLTARAGIDDRILGIEQGADDYLTKPFDLRELEARIHALIRRCYGGFSSDMTLGRLTIDSRHRQVKADQQPLSLTAREYEVLEVLAINAGRVVTKDRIAQRLASNGDALANNAIEVYVHRLRKRLEPYRVMIRTLRGLGYLLEVDDEAQQ